MQADDAKHLQSAGDLGKVTATDLNFVQLPRNAERSKRITP
jgi:hypothetical protein